MTFDNNFHSYSFIIRRLDNGKIQKTMYVDGKKHSSHIEDESIKREQDQNES